MRVDNDLSRLQDNLKNCSWPQTYYSKVQFLIAAFKPEVLVEVGVAYGYHANHILVHNPAVHYVGIDPYLPNYDKKDPFSRDVQALFPSATPEESMNRLHAAVLSQLDSWKDRAKLIRETSQVAAQSFAPSSVDMVFVDANHTFDAAYFDIKTWFSKLRGGGSACRR